MKKSKWHMKWKSDTITLTNSVIQSVGHSYYLSDHRKSIVAAVNGSRAEAHHFCT